MKLVSLDRLPEGAVSHNPKIKRKTLLGRGDVAHLTYLARAEFPPGEVVAAHGHADMSEVFVVVSGAGVIRVDGVSHALAPGVCVAVEAGESHEVANTGASELALLYFGVEARTPRGRQK